MMHAYIAARTQGEALVRATGIPATILRPWYVLGPATGGRTRCCRSTGSSRGCRRSARARGD